MCINFRKKKLNKSFEVQRRESKRDNLLDSYTQTTSEQFNTDSLKQWIASPSLVVKSQEKAHIIWKSISWEQRKSKMQNLWEKNKNWGAKLQKMTRDTEYRKPTHWLFRNWKCKICGKRKWSEGQNYWIWSKAGENENRLNKNEWMQNLWENKIKWGTKLQNFNKGREEWKSIK